MLTLRVDLSCLGEIEEEEVEAKNKARARWRSTTRLGPAGSLPFDTEEVAIQHYNVPTIHVARNEKIAEHAPSDVLQEVADGKHEDSEEDQEVNDEVVNDAKDHVVDDHSEVPEVVHDEGQV